MRIPIFLFLMIGMVSAQVNNYYVVPLGGMLAVLIVAVSYMLSQILQNPQLAAWAKSEWRELIIAGLICGLVYSALSVSKGEILGTITGYNPPTFIENIRANYTSFQKALSDDFEDTIKVGQRVGALSSYTYTSTVSAGFIARGATAAPFQGSSGMMQSILILGNNVSNGIMIYSALILFLNFFSYLSYEWILPFALAFRFIPFTRKIGGTLIALALSGVFIYPFSMALVGTMHEAIGVPHSQITSAHLNDIELKLSPVLVTLCQNKVIRFFVSLSEVGWWFIFCTPYCLLWAISLCAATGPGFPLCFKEAFWACWPPFYAACWHIITSIYQGVQTAFLLASSILLVTASKQIVSGGTDTGRVYDIVTNHLLIPVGNAASVPIMEAVLIGGLSIVGAKSLSDVLQGEVRLVGLERLI